MQLKASVILVRVVHTRLSPGFNHKVWNIVTQALLRVVQFSAGGTASSTASCSVGFTKHNMDAVLIKNNLPSPVVLRIIYVKVKKLPELGHFGLLYCLPVLNQKYISMTLIMTHFHWQVASET